MDGEQQCRILVRGKEVKHDQGWSCYQCWWKLPPPSILLFHASGETHGLCPHGLFMLHWSIFAWTFVPLTLRCVEAELLPWVLVSCSYSGPDTEGPAVGWSLVAGTADLLRLLGAHIHSLFFFPSVHAERRGETSSPEGQNILVPGLRLGEGIPVARGEVWEGGREPSNPSEVWLQLLTSEVFQTSSVCLMHKGPDCSFPHH